MAKCSTRKLTVVPNLKKLVPCKSYHNEIPKSRAKVEYSFYFMRGSGTVAGEATSKSIGSKIKFVVFASCIISPDMRHNFLLSSKTVFMFSIQTASTGPSKINHFL